MDTVIKVNAAFTELQQQIQIMSQRCIALAGELAEEKAKSAALVAANLPSAQQVFDNAAVNKIE